MINFRRIAILEPTMVFPRPFAALSEKEVVAHVRLWAEVTLKNGADAWYFRFHNQYEIIPVIQKAVASLNSIANLIPYPATEYARQSDWIHFRREEIGIITHGKPKGRSCHSVDELISAFELGFDYVFYAPIFETRTHPEVLPLGLKALEKACSAVAIPIFALGGINAENEADCLEAGAYGIAGIRMFIS